MGVLDFFGREAGQRRRAALDEFGRSLEQYVPPEMRGLLGFAAEMTPTATLERAGQASQRMFDADRTATERVGDLGAMLSETAGVVAPMMVAPRAGMTATQAVQEGLLGFSAGSRQAGRAVVDRLNQPGPVPTMYSNPVMAPYDMGQGFADEATNTGIRAYHGSPHDFDKFSMDKIGTGEGAQAYGHGLYFAENEAVARGYRDNIGTGVSYKGRPIMANRQDGTMVNPVAARIAQTGEDAETAIKSLAQKYTTDARMILEKGRLPFPGADPEKFHKEYMEMAEQVRQLNPDDFGNSGRMYEVQIDANPADFLDWDAPLSEQSEKVRSAWDKFLGTKQAARASEGMGGALLERRGEFENPTGSDFLGAYSSAAPHNNADPFDYKPKFSNTLKRQGIPGIKYFDAGSRGMDGEGSRNFVVFDENLISIVKKYGIAGAAAMLGVSALDVESAMAQGHQPPQPQGLLGGVQ